MNAWLGLARLCLMLLVGLSSVACAQARPAPVASRYASDVAVDWFDLSLDLVRETHGFSPPVASRSLGYLGVGLYETVQPGMPGYRSLAGQLNGLARLPQAESMAGYHWPTAANTALASLTRKFFANATPENLARVDALEASYAARYKAEVDGAVYWRSVEWGRSMADAIYGWSRLDGGDGGHARNFPQDYVPASGPGMWVSTPPNYGPPLQPYWGDNRPFVLPAGDACPVSPPYDYSEQPDSLFYKDALEVYQTVRDLTPEQMAIARFWADDAGKTSTPPGHWISILNQVLVQEAATLDVAAEAYAKLGMALADSFIVCWHTKFQYNLIRPISYIQAVIDPTWNTPQVTDPVTTPPFPEYTSGHSVQSGAAALVLTAIFGEGYAFTDHTHDDLGMAPRSYPSFMAAAQEAAISRLYGGIHYRAAIERGLDQGVCVGVRVLALDFRDVE